MMTLGKDKKNILHLTLGPVLFAAALLLLRQHLPFSAAVALGAIAWMAYWWILLPVEPGVTAFIPIIVNAIFGIVPMPDLMSKYITDVFYLLLGANLLAISWEVTGLDRRLALKSLYLIGTSLKQQVVVWFIVSVLLSTFLPNIVVCAMLSLIAASMLRYVMDEDFAKSKAGVAILLAIVWGVGIGAIGTPLGGAMNLVAVDYIQNLSGAEFLYTAWIVRMLPFLIVLSAVGVIYLLLIIPGKTRLEGSKEYFRGLYRELPPMSKNEKISMVFFFIAVALSFSRELYASILPELKPAVSFLICGMATFLVRKQDGKPLLDWKEAQKKILWGMIFMLGGGLAIGFMIAESGAAGVIGSILSDMELTGDFIVILAIVTITMLLSEISSNTTSAAITVPIVISVTGAMGRNPIPYIFITIAAFNCAYMLPTAVRAIPIGYGVTPGVMFKKGVALFAASVLAVSALGYLLLKLWPLFSVV